MFSFHLAVLCQEYPPITPIQETIFDACAVAEDDKYFLPSGCCRMIQHMR